MLFHFLVLVISFSLFAGLLRYTLQRCFQLLPAMDKRREWWGECQSLDIGRGTWVLFKDFSKGFLQNATLNDNGVDFKLFPPIVALFVSNQKRIASCFSCLCYFFQIIRDFVDPC